MKKFLKTILFATIIALSSFAANAETLLFNATEFSFKEYGTWSSWRSCSVPITIDLTNDIVMILSDDTQYYNIVSYEGTSVDNNGNQIMSYRFVDQDGDRGTMYLVMKRNGRSEIYVNFANVSWAYRVFRR